MNAVDQGRMNVLTERVIGCAYEVSNVLGVGFLERVYQRALARELKLNGIACELERPLIVDYKGEDAGTYQVDVFVARQLIVELKCVKAIVDEHLAQTLNYLKASNLQLGLILNFQRTKVEVRRVVRDF